MKKVAQYLIVIALYTAITTSAIHAHCQIPCGIYNDQMRIHMMEEHVATIEKSIKQIETGENQNQTVRWVMNKEKHADELTEIATYYFLAQRIKPGMDHYEKNLKTLHEIIIYSMKAKQSTDLKHVEKLNELLHSFEHTYFGEKHQH